jgi:hypothetical protein
MSFGLKMTVIKFIKGQPVRIGGEQHTGWLPPGAAVPLPTPTRDIRLDVEIQFDGCGYLLCFSSTDGTVFGDRWHESEADAEAAATEYFGIAPSEWTAQGTSKKQ